MSLIRSMNSSVAERMDKGFFPFEASSNISVISEIEEEFGKTNYGKVKFSENEMYWMGYLYRYWCYTYGRTSKQVYRIIKPTELRTLFFPYLYNPTFFAKKSNILTEKSNSFAKYFVP